MENIRDNENNPYNSRNKIYAVVKIKTDTQDEFDKAWNSLGMYDEKDCNWVEFIKCMRGVGIPVEMLIEYVAMFRLGKETIAARKALLVEQRQQLADKIVAMQAVLERLDMKIDGYEERCLKFEEENLRQ